MFKSKRAVINKINQIEQILGKKLISWKILTSNYKHILFEINNKWIFKFFRSQEYIKRKSSEEEVIKKIRSISPLQVPTIEYSGIDFLGYPKIKGQSFNDQIWRNMNKSEQSTFAAEVADFLKTFHNLSEPLDGIEEKWPPNQDWLYGEISQKIYPKLSTKAQQNISHYLDEAFLDEEIMAGQKTLVHGDFNEANIIVNNNKLSGIIDFENSKIMTPAYDFAGMHISFRDPIIVDEILEKYNRPIDKCIKKRINFIILFCELMLGCSRVHQRNRILYRLEKKYGEIKKAQLYKILNLKYHIACHYKILKYEGFKKYLLHSYNYRKQQAVSLIGKR